MLSVIGQASSINVRKVLWTCAEIGLPFVREEPGRDLGSLNPNALVPVIRDGDFVLWESNTICRYLARHHGRTDLLPAAPRAQADVERWMDWQATELNNAWRYAFMALVRRSPTHADPAQVKLSVVQWNRHLVLLDRQLQSTRAFVTGPRFTLADIVLGLSLQRWLMAPIERPPLPALDGYHARLLDRPGFKAHGANGDP
jgi:glutathione S-transferase